MAMHDFGVSLRLGKMVFMVSRLKTNYLKRVLKYRTRFGRFCVVVEDLDLES